MIWCIYIALIVVGLFLRNSKPYALAVILFMGFLAWDNTGAADYYNIYWLPYQDPSVWLDFEPGWRFLCELGGHVGLSYNGFACLVAMLSTALLYTFAKGAHVNTSLFLSLFLIYPGPMSLVQFRQFIASTIVAGGLLFLLRSERSKYIAYAFIALLAYSIHRSALLMLPAVFFPIALHAGKRERILLALIALVFAAYVTINAEVLSTYFFGEAKTSAYLLQTESIVGEATRLGGIRNVVYLIGFAALSLYLHKFSKRDEIGAKVVGGTRGDFWAAILGVNIIVLLLVPFATITNDFMRFQRYAFTYSIAFFSLMPMLSVRHRLLSCKAFYAFVCLAFV